MILQIDRRVGVRAQSGAPFAAEIGAALKLLPGLPTPCFFSRALLFRFFSTASVQPGDPESLHSKYLVALRYQVFWEQMRDFATVGFIAAPLLCFIREQGCVDAYFEVSAEDSHVHPVSSGWLNVAAGL